MAIFNKSTFEPVVEQDEDIVGKYPNIIPTIECGYEIACEGYYDLYKLIGGLYISDIMIEQAVSEGADAEALTENAITDFVNKAVDTIKKIGEKISVWFRKIIDDMKVRFTTTSNFVKKYESRIREKAKNIKDFKPKRHNFTTTDIYKEFSDMLTKISEFAKKDSEDDDSDHSTFTTRMVQFINSKATTIGELKTIVKKDITGDITDTSISSSDIDDMIKYTVNVGGLIADIKDLEGKNKQIINKTISDLKGSGKTVNVITVKTNNYKSALSAIQQLNSLGVSLANMINREYVAVLRSLLLYSVKESADDELLESSNSIFESAMNMF